MSDAYLNGTDVLGALVTRVSPSPLVVQKTATPPPAPSPLPVRTTAPAPQPVAVAKTTPPPAPTVRTVAPQSAAAQDSPALLPARTSATPRAELPVRTAIPTAPPVVEKRATAVPGATALPVVEKRASAVDRAARSALSDAARGLAAAAQRLSRFRRGARAGQRLSAKAARLVRRAQVESVVGDLPDPIDVLGEVEAVVLGEFELTSSVYEIAGTVRAVTRAADALAVTVLPFVDRAREAGHTSLADRGDALLSRFESLTSAFSDMDDVSAEPGLVPALAALERDAAAWRVEAEAALAGSVPPDVTPGGIVDVDATPPSADTSAAPPGGDALPPPGGDSGGDPGGGGEEPVQEPAAGEPVPEEGAPPADAVPGEQDKVDAARRSARMKMGLPTEAASSVGAKVLGMPAWGWGVAAAVTVGGGLIWWFRRKKETAA